MNLINHKAYISSDISVGYSEIESFSFKSLEVIDETDIAKLLGALSAFLRGIRSFSLVITRSDIDLDVASFRCQPGSITVFSSGTTGTPKPKTIPFDSLIARISSKIDEGEVIASGYDLTKFSGLQAILACLKNSATYIDVGMRFDVLSKARVDRIVGTPSWCNYLAMNLANTKSETCDLVHSITLGGEAADLRTLKILKSIFQNAQINQIYASTEAGVLFNVKDELPGLSISSALAFSADKRISWSEDLTHLPIGGHVELMFFDPVSGEETRSGDIFEKQSGRLVFYGRNNDCVSVGGQNVSLIVLENFVNAYQNVVASRALAKKSSMMGHVLTLEIKLKDGVDLQEIKKSLLHDIKNQLGKAYFPAVILEVSVIKLNSNGKVARL